MRCSAVQHRVGEEEQCGAGCNCQCEHIPGCDTTLTPPHHPAWPPCHDRQLLRRCQLAKVKVPPKTGASLRNGED